MVMMLNKQSFVMSSQWLPIQSSPHTVAILRSSSA